MKIVTSQQMRELDRLTIEHHGTPGLTLMENAGRGVVDALNRAARFVSGRRVAVVCGKGNNGGDGLVAGRLLREQNWDVGMFLLASPESYEKDAAVNFGRYRDAGGTHTVVTDLSHFTLRLRESDWIIDAIFGTGFRGAATGRAADLIAAINDAGRPVLSVDVPSGIDSDTGSVPGPAVRATLTVTLGLPKRGLVLFPGAEFAGRLEVVDIGIPSPFIDELQTDLELLESRELARSLPARRTDAHKGSFGHVAVLAGSLGKSGAASLAGLAALRIGAGLVTVAMPRSLEGTQPDRRPELMTLPLAETADQTLSTTAFQPFLKFLEGKTAACIGPGLSTHPETVQFVRDLIVALPVPAVVDADGLNALAGAAGLLKKARAPMVLTPHPGEMARLAETTTREVQSDRVAVAKDFSRRHGVTLVLKGARTVVATSTGRIYINSTGNPGMATAGTGDVLAGAIAGLMAQGLAPEAAAGLGVYLHGFAGDLAADEVGGVGMIAGDVLDRLPRAITAMLPWRSP